MCMDSLRITTGWLTIDIFSICLLLLVIYIFIFLGIEAFALGGTFGSIINSLIPIGIFVK